MEKQYPYIERDISWLSFNHRVLQEAKDPIVPLFERIKFMAIYSSNLGEFFAVRVAQQRNLLRISKKTKKELDLHPRVILKTILKIVNEQQEEFNEIFENQIEPELNRNKIFIFQDTPGTGSSSPVMRTRFQRYKKAVRSKT